MGNQDLHPLYNNGNHQPMKEEPAPQLVSSCPDNSADDTGSFPIAQASAADEPTSQGQVPSSRMQDGSSSEDSLRENLADEWSMSAGNSNQPMDDDKSQEREPSPASAEEEAASRFVRFRSRSDGSILRSPEKGLLKKDSDVAKSKRRVSFADANGLALEHVRHLVDSRSSFDFDNDTDDLFLNTGEAKKEPPHLRHSPATERRFVPYFSLPWGCMSNQKMLYAALEDRKVCLEAFSITSPWRITGTILAKNLCFHKKVFVRQSLDKWRTFKDVDAEFVCSVNSNVDRFHFDLRFPFKLMAGTRLELALGYDLLDRHAQYWDNNSECNYAFWYNDKVSNF